jgi:hypothetical protein
MLFQSHYLNPLANLSNVLGPLILSCVDNTPLF